MGDILVQLSLEDLLQPLFSAPETSETPDNVVPQQLINVAFVATFREREPLVLKSVVPQMIPAFVYDQYPRFVTFLESFCDYIERRYAPDATYDPGPYRIVKNLTSFADIDLTLDDYLVHFRHAYGQPVPDVTRHEMRSFLKQVRSFYRTKGTRRSFEFFFRAVFASFADIYLPKVDLLRSSDGKWYVPYQLMLRDMDTGLLLDDNELEALYDAKMLGQTSGATGFAGAVEVEVIIGDGPTEYNWLTVAARTGSFLAGETIEFTTSTGREVRYYLDPVSGVQNGTGRFLNEDGMVSVASKRVQDSYYWQDFSYVITSSVPLTSISDPINVAIHPAGLKLFTRIREEDAPISVLYGPGYDFSAWIKTILIFHGPYTDALTGRGSAFAGQRIRDTIIGQAHVDWGQFFDTQDSRQWRTVGFDFVPFEDLGIDDTTDAEPWRTVHPVYTYRKLTQVGQDLGLGTERWADIGITRASGGTVDLDLTGVLISDYDVDCAMASQAVVGIYNFKTRFPSEFHAVSSGEAAAGVVDFTAETPYSTSMVGATVLVFEDGRRVAQSRLGTVVFDAGGQAFHVLVSAPSGGWLLTRPLLEFMMFTPSDVEASSDSTVLDPTTLPALAGSVPSRRYFVVVDDRVLRPEVDFFALPDGSLQLVERTGQSYLSAAARVFYAVLREPVGYAYYRAWMAAATFPQPRPICRRLDRMGGRMTVDYADGLVYLINFSAASQVFDGGGAQTNWYSWPDYQDGTNYALALNDQSLGAEREDGIDSAEPAKTFTGVAGDEVTFESDSDTAILAARSLNTDPFSLLLVFRADSDPATLAYVGSPRDGISVLTARSIHIRRNGVAVQVYTYNGGVETTTTTAASAAGDIVDDDWNVVLVVYTGTELRIYVNGYDPKVASIAAINVPATSGAVFSSAVSGEEFEGAGQLAAYWSRELTSTEVSAVRGLGNGWIEPPAFS